MFIYILYIYIYDAVVLFIDCSIFRPSVPIPFLFTEDPNGGDLIKPILDQWGGYAFRLKEPGARYAQPAPVVPQAPSARLNARVAPDMQPGQLAVG